jgi:hypothetical protein
MSYWKLIPPLVDGEPVGAIDLGEEDVPTEPDAVVVSYYPDPEHYVWDADTQAIMPISFEQRLAREKQRKADELKRAASAEYDQTVTRFDGDVVASKIGNAQLSPYEQGVRDKMNDIYQRRDAKRQQLQAATTLDEVKQIQW